MTPVTPRRTPRLRLVPVAILCAAWFCLAASAWAQAELHALDQPVNDFARVIDPANADRMDRAIRALQQATGDVVVVVTVPTFAPYGDIREYAVKLFENRDRGIGDKDKDNGALILLAVNDRRVWVEVGYGLEEFITDGFAGETSRDFMTPHFRQGQYGAGLRAGLERIVGRIADGRGVTLDGVERVPRAAGRRGTLPSGLVVLGIVVLFLLMQLFGGGGGRGRGFRRRGSHVLWGGGPWSGWNSGVGSFGGGGGFGGGFGGFGGGSSGGGGGGASW